MHAPDRCCGKRISERPSTAVRSAIAWAIGSTCPSCPGSRCSCSRSTNEYGVGSLNRLNAWASSSAFPAAELERLAQARVHDVDARRVDLRFADGGEPVQRPPGV